MIADQKNVPAYSKDHACFKRFAAKKQMSMKDLFAAWILEHEPKKEKIK